MSCATLPKFAPPPDGAVDISWDGIAAVVRAYAGAQAPGVAGDLCEWADFIDEVAELRPRIGRR